MYRPHMAHRYIIGFPYVVIFDGYLQVFTVCERLGNLKKSEI